MKIWSSCGGFQKSEPHYAASARVLAMTDFEDAVVATVAETSGSSLIITRNTNDFTRSPVPAISPVEFLSQFDLSQGSSTELP